jgi:hypothetical protein
VEPQYSFEPLLDTWTIWQWGQYPGVTALLQSNQHLTLHSAELSRLFADLNLRSSAAALQTFFSGAHLIQQAWLQSALALGGGGDDSEATHDDNRLVTHAAHRSEKPERAEAPGAAAETREDWGPEDVDAAFSSHAA